MACLCVSQQGEFKKAIKNFWGGVHVNVILQNNSVIFFFGFLLPRFLAISLHEELKNTIQISSQKKIFLENLQKNLQKIGRSWARRFFFPSAPLDLDLRPEGRGPRAAEVEGRTWAEQEKADRPPPDMPVYLLNRRPTTQLLFYPRSKFEYDREDGELVPLAPRSTSPQAARGAGRRSY
jgi:hypothetical protein